MASTSSISGDSVRVGINGVSVTVALYWADCSVTCYFKVCYEFVPCESEKPAITLSNQGLFW